MKFKRIVITVLVFSIVLLAINNFGAQKRTCSFYSMGGILTEIQGYHTTRKTFNLACGKIITYFEDTENEISNYRAGSYLSKLNNRNDKSMEILPERTFYLLKESLEISKKTKGYYDVSVLPLVELWQQAEKQNKVPSESQISNALKTVSYRKVVIQNEKSRKVSFLNPSMKFDFGAIGKGFMGDAAVRIMQAEGIPRGLVNCGGGVVVYDKRDTPKPFHIKIYNPDHESETSVVSLLNESVQTSGDYNRFHEIEGKKYSHILNPYTGFPGGSCHSITVKASNGTIADGYSTGFCSMLAAGLDPYKFIPDGVEILQLKKVK